MNEDRPLHYLIVVRSPHVRADLEGAKALLEPLEVRVDESYPPVPLDGEPGGFLVRGTATDSAAARAQALEDVQFFPDLEIGPAARSR